MEKIENIFRWLSESLDKIAALIVLPGISIIVIVDVFRRYVMNDPWIWSLEFNEWMLLLIFAFAIPECTRQNGHIRMELLVGNLPRKLQDAFDVIYICSAMWLFYLLGSHAWEEFLFDYELNRITEYVRLPIWGHHLAMFIMCVILEIYYLLRLVCALFGYEQFSRTDALDMGE
jgi:TRAP-type C4-dicarboxylate transport system permease small subunit